MIQEADRRRRSKAPRAAVFVMLTFALSLWAPTASTAQVSPQEFTVETAVEAWYYVADETASPGPLPVIPDPVNPYGEDTLHVSVTLGQEESRTYIAFDLAALPPTFELVEGVLTLPIDPAGATMNAETARIQVCLSDIPPKNTEGSFDEPPEFECKISARADYEEKPSPHLLVDITDFGSDLTFSGLAIMPSERAKEQGDTWHITFYGKKNQAETAEPITADIRILPADELGPIIDISPPTTTGTDSSTQDFGSSSTGGFDFDSSTGPSVDVGTAPIEDAGQEPIDTGTPIQTDETLELAAESKPAYTIVWALPLLLLALSIYFSSALTREVVLRRNS